MSRDGQRHLILATNDQLKFLARCRRWYIDGTFKIVAKPFYQLLSIHGFLKKDDMMKQVIQATDFFFFSEVVCQSSYTVLLKRISQQS